MADTPDDQDYFGGLAQDLLGKFGLGVPAASGMGAALMQGLTTPPAAASLPAAGHLLGHVPTFAPPALGDSVQPVGMPTPGNADDVSQEIGQETIEDGRPNLGWSNLIRDLLPRGFSRDMFDNYIQGKGDYELSPDRFQDIVNAANAMPPPKLKDVVGPNGEYLQRRIYNFSDSPDYEKSLGSARLFYDRSGQPVGFYDNYNFDPAKNKRSTPHELETRAMYGVHALGWTPSAKPFQIRYGVYVPPT